MKEIPELEQLSSSKFYSQGDRGTALLACAWVDDTLASLVKSQLLSNAEIVEDMFRPDGTLGTFSSRIKIAYLMGLIDKPTHSDLDIIRRIRNEFAHVREDIRFTNPRVRSRCSELKVAKAYESGAGPIRSCRERFLISCYFLSHIFLQQSNEQKRAREMIPGILHSYVRRLGKMHQVLNALDQSAKHEATKSGS
jgi:DNA-binding MltR family transcriptional regulator